MSRRLDLQVKAIELLDACRTELARDPHVLHQALLESRHLAKRASDLGISLFDEKQVNGLWSLGLLRADCVKGYQPSTPLEFLCQRGSLRKLGEDVLYDNRQITVRGEGYGGSLSSWKNECVVRPLFHPFRVFVLARLFGVFKGVRTSMTQYFMYPPGFARLAERECEYLNERTASVEFAELVEDWNRIAELSIVVEPSTFPTIFGFSKFHSPDSSEVADSKRLEYRNSSRALLENISLETVGEVRGILGRCAESSDSNNMLHVVLRLMSGRERLKLKDSLGTAMTFLAMSEAIRREAEYVHGGPLPEEDEIGFGHWMPGARKTIYGTDRIFDSQGPERRDFLTLVGLDAGVKCRCYVEGGTEFGALTYALEDIPGIEVIDLAGHFIASAGKGLAFVDSLKADIRAGVFSVVLLDADRLDNVRAVKKAAKEGNLFGRFFVHSPDFEFDNFDREELVDIALADESNSKKLNQRKLLIAAVRRDQTGESLMCTLRANGVECVKGRAWGEALMKHALVNPTHIRNQSAGRTRKLVEIVEFVIRSLRCGYARSRDSLVLDHESGDLVPIYERQN